jgi:hypothetical protein
MKFVLMICTALLLSTPAISQNTLPMAMVQNRFLIIEAVVNDSIKANFILDTGAGLEVVSTHFFEQVKNTATPAGIMTGFTSIGGRVDLELYRIPSMRIGDLEKKETIIAPYSNLDELTGIAGLVSLKFFENQPFTMDFVSGKLILETPNSLETLSQHAESFPLEAESHRDISLDVFLPLVLDERIDILAEFDTGTGIDIMINPYYFAALAIDTLSTDCSKEHFQNPDGSSQYMYVSTISSIGLPDSELIRGNDMKAFFLEDFIYEGLIGWQLFKNNRVTIDYPNRRMLVR